MGCQARFDARAGAVVRLRTPTGFETPNSSEYTLAADSSFAFPKKSTFASTRARRPRMNPNR